ncbi:acyl-[ACP]--phospholipid O-acyltransferase [Neptunomonas phycophila]|uniref:Acyl-[ACP]--phospholipid O-acyltransferase n=1 Tax=Neptunomonas phycophila TaxID=1572645 RepID=A0AAW7XKJ9_9GAMM|nr:acyl-[ACP]--phospholipid O-acyltransferase [Neptunomonas phycophila]MDO6454843.1 acyl-[ACP]--phospholipid O-acyltransferase [Neptunomonas phycophila]
MLTLLKIPGFLAFLMVAFLNAFVDLGHKIIIQNTLFKSFDGDQQIILTAVVNALILLPFILMLSPSGFISTRFSKPTVMRWAARSAVVITSLITLSYYQGWFELSFALTFLLALQSAVYSPAKYGFIRDLLGADRLSEGNGWIQSVTMVAILSGIVVFSLMFEGRLASGSLELPPDQILTQIAPLGWFLIAFAVFEAIMAQRLPHHVPESPHVAFDWSGYTRGRLLRANMKALWGRRRVIESVFGLAVFWTISQIMLAVFPTYAEQNLGETNTFIIQGAMALAGIGIMIGSAIAGRLSHQHINTGLIPLGALGVALGLWLLPSATSMIFSAGMFFLIGVSGALMIIPLNALIQFHAPEKQLSTVLAGNNFIQNIAMIAGLMVTVVASVMALGAGWLLYLLAGVATLGAFHAVKQLPEALIRLLVSTIIRRKYNLKVLGFYNLAAEGQGMLLLGNHISWLDWAMIQMACPRHIHFVMERSIYERWYLKWFLNAYKVIPISGGHSRKALEDVNQLLKEGAVVCLFPEGAISHTGQLGEFKRGFEIAAKDSNAVIVPFYLRGLWGSRFSRSGSKLQETSKGGMKRDVIVAYGEAMSADSTAAQVKQKVFELSISAWQTYTDTLPCIDKAFVQTMKAAPAAWAITDVEGQPLSHSRLLTAVLLFRKHIKRLKGQNIGVLVPTSSGGAIANMAGLIAGKTIVNLNYTASEEAVGAAIEQAEINTVITSKLFMARLKTKGFAIGEWLDGCEVVYLEDVRDTFTAASRLRMLALVKLLPASLISLLYCRSKALDDTAAILFSSGSEGLPKGVMLSHRNIMANAKQIADVLNMTDDDVVMASLPLFHAFGLTATCYMPLISGVPMVCQPDPTDAVAVGKGVARYRATLLFGTSTFFRLYSRNKKLLPEMFRSLRITVSGAEKLQPEVREQFELRFKTEIVEGYGCTETTPVAGVNLPDYLDTQWWRLQKGNKAGTIGMALPGSMFRVVDPDTLETLPTGEAGLILIGGTQIMKGYLNNPEKTQDVIVLRDGVRWYKSGDKGWLDEDGFLTIVDRYSRFAKLGGEMVGLSDIEARAKKALALPETPMVAVNLPDSKKGEKVVLLIEGEGDSSEARKRMVDSGMPGLMIPSSIYFVESVPVLGSGKTDFGAAKKMALSCS